MSNYSNISNTRPMKKAKIDVCALSIEQKTSSHLACVEIVLTAPCFALGFVGNVEVVDNHVTVCRDDVSGRCTRALCKYYHIPVELPPAPQMARLHSLVNNSSSGKPAANKQPDPSASQHEVVVHQQAAPVVYAAASDCWQPNDDNNN